MDYRELKKEILKTYEYFDCGIKYFRKEAQNMNFSLPVSDEKLEQLKTKCDEIKQDNFKLMVFGEAKSGKSTFINAYLGINLLPTNSLQCTSSIIKIKNGSSLKLKVTYANNSYKEYKNEKEIKEILERMGSLEGVEDKYKYIPTVRINNDIFLVKQGREIHKKEITDFINVVKEEKVPSMSDEEYENLIREYINKYQYKWQKIVKEILIEYPFDSENLKDIEIIDSPGINAMGGLEDITREYTKKVDALMFLQSAEVPAENKNLREIVDKYSSNKNTSFLIITKSGKSNKKDLELKFDEIKGYYKGFINEEQIVYIDSLFEDFSNYVEKNFFESPYQKLKTYIKENKETIEPSIRGIVLENDTIEEAIEELKKESNFNKLKKTLDLFGRKAPYLKLYEFSNEILKYLKDIRLKLQEQINLYEIKDPVYFEKEIDRLIKNIMELKEKIDNTKVKLEEEYFKELVELIDERKNVIEKKINMSKSYDELKNVHYNEVESFKDFQITFANKLILDLDNNLIKKDGNVEEFAYMTPKFTEEDLKKIDNISKAKAEEITKVEEGITFKDIKYVTKFSQDKYLSTIRTSISDRFDEIYDEIRNYMGNYIDNIIEKYTEELKENLEVRENELKGTERNKFENEEKIKNRNFFNKQIISFNDIDSKLEVTLKELEKNIK